MLTATDDVPDEIPGDHPNDEEVVVVKAKIIKPSMQNVRVKCD